ncbi:hypothetical protein FKM82_019074 [Ascaphus truei]
MITTTELSRKQLYVAHERQRRYCWKGILLITWCIFTDKKEQITFQGSSPFLRSPSVYTSIIHIYITMSFAPTH